MYKGGPDGDLRGRSSNSGIALHQRRRRKRSFGMGWGAGGMGMRLNGGLRHSIESFLPGYIFGM